MKLSAAVLLASVAGSSAFTAPATSKAALSSRTAVRMSEDAVDAPTASEDSVEEEISTPPPAALPSMSQSLPFMARPAALDGSMAGDVGFDPLGFAKSSEDLMNYREAEVKHARLAMLAAAGWPLSELFDKKIAALTHLTPLVGDDDRAPSVLNGGLGKVPAAYWVACILAAGAIDVYGIAQSKKNDPDYFPGNFGFDPLGLYPADKEGQLDMQLREIKNGRLAMVAITGFALQEFVSKLGVVDETPVFFKPFGTVIHEWANYGYYHPN